MRAFEATRDSFRSWTWYGVKNGTFLEKEGKSIKTKARSAAEVDDEANLG